MYRIIVAPAVYPVALFIPGLIGKDVAFMYVIFNLIQICNGTYKGFVIEL